VTVSGSRPLRQGSGEMTPAPPGAYAVEASLPAWEPPPSVAAGIPPWRQATVRLSLRIVVQLDRWRPPSDGGPARWESTQQGLAERLSATQGAVSKVLSRLVAAEVVYEGLRHVHGRDQRVRVYYLTAQGEALAREIEQRFGLPAPPGSREPPNCG